MPHRTISRRDFLTRILAGAAAASAIDLTRAADALAQAQEREPRGRMHEGEPSATAQGTAMQRAAHQVYDAPRVIEDPIALRIIGAERAEMIQANPDWYQRPAAYALRAFLVMRARYAEDAVAEAVRRGICQYVVLGAGLDTFAYRNPHEGRLRVLEVDHPSTQAWKRDRLADARVRVPPSLTFAPVDFEKQTLAEGLARAGFRREAPAVFSWLGVVMYLTRSAITETLRTVVALPRGTEIVFDFMQPMSALSDAQKPGREAGMRRVAALGEPWLSFFEPAQLAREVRAAGYSHVELFGREDANRRYFAGREDDLYVRSTSQLIRARV